MTRVGGAWLAEVRRSCSSTATIGTSRGDSVGQDEQPVVRVLNSEALESRFGEWPSFHDAEILSLRLDSGQRSDGIARLELDVHLFAVDGVLPNGRVNFVLHTVATLQFEGVEDVELGGFGPQNVLFDLVLRDIEGGGPSLARAQVELPSSNGLGGSFRCRNVIVRAADPYEPGPHSVYRRT